MSRLTGYLFAQKAVELCAREKGTFCAANEPFLPGGRAVIIGSGNIGLSALKYLSDLNLRLSIIHNGPLATVQERMERRFGNRAASGLLANPDLRFIRMNANDPARTKAELAELIGEADILINAAVRRPSLPKTTLEYLVDRAMVARMVPGSVVCDATACDRDMIETCVSSPSLHETYREADVVHYNCDHIPALVARTASELLAESTFPYVLRLAEKGAFRAIQSDAALRNGVSCCEGWVTHKFSAEKKNLPYRPIENFLCAAGGIHMAKGSTLAPSQAEGVR
jgi:alanine dehydrogenase